MAAWAWFNTPGPDGVAALIALAWLRPGIQPAGAGNAPPAEAAQIAGALSDWATGCPPPPPPLSPHPRAWGRIVLPTTDSTMAEAARQAPTLAAPTWICALEQTAARALWCPAPGAARRAISAASVAGAADWRYLPRQGRACRSFVAPALALGRRAGGGHRSAPGASWG